MSVTRVHVVQCPTPQHVKFQEADVVAVCSGGSLVMFLLSPTTTQDVVDYN